MSYTIDLSGRTALVTGASSGLGRHFATVLAQAGAQVVLAARRIDALSSLQTEIRDAGGSAELVGLDVTDPRAVATAVAEAQRIGAGQLDIVVNNAGVALTKPFLELTPEDWDGVLDTNLRGAFLVGQAAARQMKESGRGGSIINIASILGLRVAGQVSAYATSKAALVQLTRAMALELARYGIRVNALCPGYVETDLNRDFFATDVGKDLIRRVPQRRLGQMSDLDGALLLLAGDAGRSITGADIPVDGGHLVSSL
ncbi:glucose 1-dehydrogenase [Enterovirga sp. CN4-39]|uniref:glucose 1-dehydrogenase n=1 Tax=Enterovirga sp. CN4-39 TaxID=3400910 RepID=UPI003C0829C5